MVAWEAVQDQCGLVGIEHWLTKLEIAYSIVCPAKIEWLRAPKIGFISKLSFIEYTYNCAVRLFPAILLIFLETKGASLGVTSSHAYQLKPEYRKKKGNPPMQRIYRGCWDNEEKYFAIGTSGLFTLASMCHKCFERASNTTHGVCI